MDHFNYKGDGLLYAEDVSIKEIAEDIGTPFYCYSHATLARHYKAFKDSFIGVEITLCYAVKANSNLAVIKTLADLGAGADVVSEGEIRRALAAKIPAEKIVFSGVGKTRGEMEYALQVGIHQFNVESLPELELLNDVAMSLGVKAPIALRINPDVAGDTHDKISTGRKEDKFGIDIELALDYAQKASEMGGIEMQGISCHIGSQITSVDPFKNAFKKVAELVRTLRKEGHTIKTLDLGGGVGVPYTDENHISLNDYAETVIDAAKGLDVELIFEPGRVIGGNAGILVSQITYIKETDHKTFYIVDAGMNDLIRPSFYNAYHEIVPVEKPAGDKENKKVDIVGPICETGDTFATDRQMPEMQPGDLLAFRTSGAYGAVMANNYNSRLLVPEVMVNKDAYAVVRRRETYAEMLEREEIPEW